MGYEPMTSSVWVNEYISYPRPRDHCYQPTCTYIWWKWEEDCQRFSCLPSPAMVFNTIPPTPVVLLNVQVQCHWKLQMVSIAPWSTCIRMTNRFCRKLKNWKEEESKHRWKVIRCNNPCWDQLWWHNHTYHITHIMYDNISFLDMWICVKSKCKHVHDIYKCTIYILLCSCNIWSI